MASGHSATGALLCGAVAPLLPSPLESASAVALGMLVGTYLALVMDLDTKGKCYYLLQPFSWVLKPLFVWISKILFALTRGPGDADSTGGHRMFTHQPVFAGLLALIPFVWLWGSPWHLFATGMVFVGVWSHRAGDACTESGVPPGIVHVIIRMMQGESKVWATVGVPRRFRFVTGGGSKSRRGKRLWREIAKSTKRPSRRRQLTLWDRNGEKAVTMALIVACVGLCFLTVIGWYPVVLT
jgi:LexA-binding, inner membrane-associated putative hydrolase